MSYTCEIALAAGCRVFGFDISQNRVDIASQILPIPIFLIHRILLLTSL